jgi:hypothetical protein
MTRKIKEHHKTRTHDEIIVSCYHFMHRIAIHNIRNANKMIGNAIVWVNEKAHETMGIN